MTRTLPVRSNAAVEPNASTLPPCISVEHRPEPFCTVTPVCAGFRAPQCPGFLSRCRALRPHLTTYCCLRTRARRYTDGTVSKKTRETSRQSPFVAPISNRAPYCALQQDAYLAAVTARAVHAVLAMANHAARALLALLTSDSYYMCCFQCMCRRDQVRFPTRYGTRTSRTRGLLHCPLPSSSPDGFCFSCCPSSAYVLKSLVAQCSTIELGKGRVPCPLHQHGSTYQHHKTALRETRGKMSPKIWCRIDKMAATSRRENRLVVSMGSSCMTSTSGVPDEGLFSRSSTLDTMEPDAV